MKLNILRTHSAKNDANTEIESLEEKLKANLKENLILEKRKFVRSRGQRKILDFMNTEEIESNQDSNLSKDSQIYHSENKIVDKILEEFYLNSKNREKGLVGLKKEELLKISEELGLEFTKGKKWFLANRIKKALHK